MALVRWMTEEMGNMLTAGNPIKRGVNDLKLLDDLQSE